MSIINCLNYRKVLYLLLEDPCGVVNQLLGWHCSVLHVSGRPVIVIFGSDTTVWTPVPFRVPCTGLRCWTTSIHYVHIRSGPSYYCSRWTVSIKRWFNSVMQVMSSVSKPEAVVSEMQTLVCSTRLSLKPTKRRFIWLSNTRGRLWDDIGDISRLKTTALLQRYPCWPSKVTSLPASVHH